jgi:Flp pilus assembly protein TadB
MTWGHRDESIEARLKNAKTRREIALAEVQRSKQALAITVGAALASGVLFLVSAALLLVFGFGLVLLVLAAIGFFGFAGALGVLSFVRVALGASREKMQDRQAEWDAINAEAARLG